MAINVEAISVNDVTYCVLVIHGGHTYHEISAFSVLSSTHYCPTLWALSHAG